MKNKLLLLSKNDIPFIKARVNIHQPTIKEISLINEENFHVGCQFLNFSIDNLSDEDKVNLRDRTDFEVFMSVMNSKEKAPYKTDALLILTLLFPEYEIILEKDKILLQKFDGSFSTSIENENFDDFKDILVSMFCLSHGDAASKYNPADARARKIAEKFKKAEQRKNKNKKIEDISIYSRYVSILSIGNHQSINELMEYTIPQLIDAMERFQAKESFDSYFKAKLAGAQDLEEVDHWIQDNHK